jgi:serine phosphatase RsbU (regulator of sigma subunit)/CheY-like chemotaxis protein
MSKDTILVVEDETMVGLELKESLERLGYAVPEVIDSGEDVVSAVARHRPDLLLMDVRLRGGVDGIEAAYQTKAEFDVPLIYLTACSDEEVLRRAALTGPDAFLLKPLDERELAVNISIALSRARSGEPLRRELRGAISLADALDAPIIIADLDGRVSHANPAATSLLGVSDSSRLARTELSGLLEMPRRRARGVVAAIEPLCSAGGQRYGSLVRLEPKGALERRLLESSAAEANSVLASLLPGPGAAGEGYRVGGFLEPCLSGSGDFFDVFRAGPDRVAFYGLDVMGHGVIASLMAFSLRECLPALAGGTGSRGSRVPKPGAVLRALHEKYSGKPGSKPRTAFFTISVGSLDTATGEYAIARGGHTPALRVGVGGGIAIHYAKGAAVGVLPDAEAEESQGRLEPGDRLLLASDGLFASFGGDGLFGEALDGVVSFAERHRASSLDDFVAAFRRRALSRSEETAILDDVSLLVIERNP